jgi:hypothetical protein
MDRCYVPISSHYCAISAMSYEFGPVKTVKDGRPLLHKRSTKRRAGEATPHFIASQWIYAEVTPDGKHLPIGAKPHASVIFRSVAWIENCSIFIVQPLPFHTFDNRQT